MILGVVLAGGKSSRFGSDKAMAILHGQNLLERAVGTLSTMCSAVCVAGRDSAPSPAITVQDWPKAGMGPLGGLAGALRYARDNGFSSVFSASVDCYNLPDTILETLSPAPAYLREQPVIGHWQTDTLSTLEEILGGDGRHSMMAFAHAIEAQPCQASQNIGNINSPADLAAAEKPNGI